MTNQTQGGKMVSEMYYSQMNFFISYFTEKSFLCPSYDGGFYESFQMILLLCNKCTAAIQLLWGIQMSFQDRVQGNHIFSRFKLQYFVVGKVRVQLS